MKAFEEWALKGRRKPTNPRIAIFASWYDQGVAERAWKAALEWFYDQLGYSQEHEELKDVIEQELEASDE